MPEMTVLVSSNVAAAGYDDDLLELTVEFKSGATYVYEAVPRHVYEGLIGSGSPGKYLNDQIKGAYGARRES